MLARVLFSKSQTTLIQYPAGRAESQYTIPESVTSIGVGAFSGCYGVTSITFGNRVTSIGDYAFYGCSGVTSITIANSVTSIGYRAFEACTNLTGVHCEGNAPTTVGSSVFVGATHATVYYLPGTTGWGTTFGERPTAPWVLPSPIILTNSHQLWSNNQRLRFSGLVGNQCLGCGRSLHGTWPIPSGPPVSTNALVGGWSDFRDPGWKESPNRFYRIRSH